MMNHQHQYLDKRLNPFGQTQQQNLLSQLHLNQITDHYKQILDQNKIPPISKLDSITVYNFKTFYGKQYIGPFMDFTSIMGRNGSGKSSVFDALIFCFCGQDTRMSRLDPRQYIWRTADQSMKDFVKTRREGWVQVKFNLVEDKQGQNHRSKKNAHLFLNNTLIIKRLVNSQGKQTYFINNQMMQKKLYEHFLFTRGINTDATNYAVWQGQIDKILFLSPLSLTQLIQKYSGSSQLKKQYDQEQLQMKNVIDSMKNISNEILKLKTLKKQLKFVVTQTNNAQESQKNFLQEKKKLTLAKILKEQFELSEMEKEFIQKKKQQGKIRDQFQKQRLQFQKQQKQKIDLETKAINIQKKLLQAKKKIEFYRNSSVDQISYNLQTVQKEIKEIQQFLDNINGRRQILKNKVQELTQSSSTSSLGQNSNLIEEYLKLYNSWQTENLNLTNELKKRKGELLHIEGLLQGKILLKQDLQRKRVNYDSFQKQNIEKSQKCTQDIKQFQKKMKNLEKEYKKKQEQYKKDTSIIQQKNQKLQKIQNQLQDLQSQALSGIQNQKQRELIQNLYQIQGFCGTLQSKIQPGSIIHQLCFSMIFQNSRKHLLCQTQQAAFAIGQHLKQIRQMKTIIILSNTSQRKQSDQFRKNIGKIASIAYDAVDINQSIKNLDLYIRNMLFGKVICKNLEQAYKVRDKRIPHVRQIYTLDGLIVKNDGMVKAFGDTQKLKRDIKYMNYNNNINGGNKALQKDIQNLLKQKNKIQNQIKQIQAKGNQKSLKGIQIEIIKAQNKIKQLKQTKNYLQGQKSKTKNKKQDIIQKFKNQQKSIDQDISKLQYKKQRIVQNVQKTQKQMKVQLQSLSVFKNFMKKNKIQSLEQFRLANSDINSIQNKMKEKKKILREIYDIQQQVQKNNDTIKRKKIQHEKLKQKLNTLENKGGQSKSIQKQIIILKKELNDINQHIRKISLNLNNSISSNKNHDHNHKQKIKFKTELPLLQQNIRQKKDSLIDFIRQEEQNLQIRFNYPRIDYSQLFQNNNNENSRRNRNKRNQRNSNSNQKMDLQQQQQQQQDIEDEEISKQRVSFKSLNLNKRKIQKIIQKMLQKYQNAQKNMKKNGAQLLLPQNHNQKMKQYQQGIKNLEKESDQLTDKRSSLSKKLTQITIKRKDKFLQFFYRLKPIVKNTYEKLSVERVQGYLNQSLYGTADIFIQNQDFPFNSGTYYTPVPAGKRYVYDLSKLSGGQKTMAALALRYSIALATSTPFMILDQPDSFLDQNNTRNLSNLIQDSLLEKEIQFLVITHKEKIYQESQSLVGLLRHNKNLSSKAFSLFLKDSHQNPQKKNINLINASGQNQMQIEGSQKQKSKDSSNNPGKSKKEKSKKVL